MRTRELTSRILEILYDASGKAVSADEIYRALKVRGKIQIKAARVLERMVQRGDVKAVGKKRYALGRQDTIVSGRVQTIRSGAAFIITEGDGPDIFVPARRLGAALPGDTVAVKIMEEGPRARQQRKSGRVIHVIERGRLDIVGTLRRSGSEWEVAPVDPHYNQRFRVRDLKGAAPGDRVVMRLQEPRGKEDMPEGRIVDVIGPERKASFDAEAILVHYGLTREFPSEVQREAERAAALLDDPGEREDLRDKLTFTVDPDTARDFDDALTLDRDSEGRAVLGVHIADVSHFVRPGEVMDEEAMRRGNSVYLPDMVVPMLPEQLSNGVCSLRPDEDRLTFSAFITLDTQRQPVAWRFAKSIIRSDHRLTYAQVRDVLDETQATAVPPVVAKRLRELSKIAQRLRRNRFARFALNLDMPESVVLLDEKGEVRDIVLEEYDASHQLIEECMVLANEVVDTELSRRDIPLIHRLHEPPATDRVDSLVADLESMGYRPGDLNQRGQLAAFLKSLETDPMAHHVRLSVLKSMTRAIYSAREAGHYGLAKTYYTHFTSPIRRYCDLVVHRCLAAALDGRRQPYRVRDLGGIAAACSATEQVAEQAERALVELKKLRFLISQIKRRRLITYRAVVVAIQRQGLFIELIDLQLRGVMSLSTSSGAEGRSGRERGRERGRQPAGADGYERGQTLDVVVSSVNMDGREAVFVPAPVPQKPRKRRNN
jgi:ribonuclease R